MRGPVMKTIRRLAVKFYRGSIAQNLSIGLPTTCGIDDQSSCCTLPILLLHSTKCLLLTFGTSLYFSAILSNLAVAQSK